MTLDDIKKLIELACRSGIARLDVTLGDARVSIVKHAAPATAPRAPVEQREAPRGPIGPVRKAPGAGGSLPREGDLANAVRAATDGIVHLRPSPDSAPFVQGGEPVAEGDTLCLIEVMKTFHAVTAHRAGTIKSIGVTDGQEVRFDDLLIELA